MKYRGQDNPKDQIRMILGSIEGHLSNLQEIGGLDEEQRQKILARKVDRRINSKEDGRIKKMTKSIPFTEDELKHLKLVWKRIIPYLQMREIHKSMGHEFNVELAESILKKMEE